MSLWNTQIECQVTFRSPGACDLVFVVWRDQLTVYVQLQYVLWLKTEVGLGYVYPGCGLGQSKFAYGDSLYAATRIDPSTLRIEDDVRLWRPTYPAHGPKESSPLLWSPPYYSDFDFMNKSYSGKNQASFQWRFKLEWGKILFSQTWVNTTFVGTFVNKANFPVGIASTAVTLKAELPFVSPLFKPSDFEVELATLPPAQLEDRTAMYSSLFMTGSKNPQSFPPLDDHPPVFGFQPTASALIGPGKRVLRAVRSTANAASVTPGDLTFGPIDRHVFANIDFKYGFAP